MNLVLAAFRSRTEALEFLEVLKRFGISAQIVSTPREARVGCGLSVRFSFTALSRVKGLLMRMGANSFAGFFVSSGYGKNTSYRPL